MKINLQYDRLTGKAINSEKYKSDSQIEVPDRCNVRDLITLLEAHKDRRESLLVHINGEPAWNITVLKENDSVKLFLMLGGG
ncbi:MAG: MoaD/ThiS family protein [Dehalococcoidia bacterium]